MRRGVRSCSMKKNLRRTLEILAWVAFSANVVLSIAFSTGPFERYLSAKQALPDFAAARQAARSTPEEKWDRTTFAALGFLSKSVLITDDEKVFADEVKANQLLLAPSKWNDISKWVGMLTSLLLSCAFFFLARLATSYRRDPAMSDALIAKALRRCAWAFLCVGPLTLVTMLCAAAHEMQLIYESSSQGIRMVYAGMPAMTNLMMALFPSVSGGNAVLLSILLFVAAKTLEGRDKLATELAETV